jgi:hypothetical protein
MLGDMPNFGFWLWFLGGFCFLCFVYRGLLLLDAQCLGEGKGM